MQIYRAELCRFYLGTFRQDANFSTSKRLQGPPQLWILWWTRKNVETLLSSAECNPVCYRSSCSRRFPETRSCRLRWRAAAPALGRATLAVLSSSAHKRQVVSREHRYMSHGLSQWRHSHSWTLLLTRSDREWAATATCAHCACLSKTSWMFLDIEASAKNIKSPLTNLIC